MEARYAIRKHQLLAECQVAPEIFEQVIPRLYTFMGSCPLLVMCLYGISDHSLHVISNASIYVLVTDLMSMGNVICVAPETASL